MRFTLDAVHLPCADMAATSAFYTETIGLRQRRELAPLPGDPPGSWIEFRSGAASLVVKPRGAVDGEARAPGAAGAHLGLRAASPRHVDALYERLRDAGAELVTEPTDWPWDERAFFFRDPAGNLAEFFCLQAADEEPGEVTPLAAVHLPCAELAATAHFYEDDLGLSSRREQIPFPDGPQDPWHELDSGEVPIVLKPHGEFDGSARPAAAAGTHLGLRVESAADVDACAERLRERGIGLAIEPTDWPWEDRSLFVRDPDGNVVEVYHGASDPIADDAAG